MQRHCLPTYRGFDTFLGYYTACTSDYWMHGAPGGNASFGKCGDVDFHDSAGTSVHGAAMTGPHSLNGTYDQVAFTQRAVDIIHANAAATPLYIYLAYHNVHDSCQEDRFASGLNAPLETVELYATTALDTFKVQGAMTTELDYGVANVTRALRASGQWENTVLIFVSDNGGPLDHSANAPLRGGKGSEWEGGYVQRCVNPDYRYILCESLSPFDLPPLTYYVCPRRALSHRQVPRHCVCPLPSLSGTRYVEH